MAMAHQAGGVFSGSLNTGGLDGGHSVVAGGASCMELALEGERLCKSGDCVTGVRYFEAAVRAGTDDLQTLSAVYSQLGNGYFYLQEYDKALHYHSLDLSVAKQIADALGEAKASGNLGNTLKVLGRFDEAIECCYRHLEIARGLNDKVSLARALYNIANVYHTKGKHMGRSTHHDPGEFPQEVKETLQKAITYYDENLTLSEELGDIAAKGRSCGNLGNTHYLLGNFRQAIVYHEERLAIAKEFGDKAAERRAYSNLGNAHIFMGEFEEAVDFYKNSLSVAHHLADHEALEAQACYSLGNTYTLLRDYKTAIEYHERHLSIAQRLHDKLGQGRAFWSLGNAYTALGDHERAMQYARKHLNISQEIGDSAGESAAMLNLSDLERVLFKNSKAAESMPAVGRSGPQQELSSLEPLSHFTPPRPQPQSFSDGSRGDGPTLSPTFTSPRTMDEEDHLFDLITKFQGRRLDDQRTSVRLMSNGKRADSKKKEDLMDMVAGVQRTRIDDQRANLPSASLPSHPGSHQAPQGGASGPRARPAAPSVGDMLAQQNGSKEQDVPDDSFFEQLMRTQSSRLEEQRTSLPPLPPAAAAGQQSATVPDEDFFSLIHRLQGDRLDEQRVQFKMKTSKKKGHK